MGLFDWWPWRSRDGEGAAVGIAAAPDTDEHHRRTKEQMLYPRGRFQGDFTPENLAFDHNLQEFAQRVAVICGLENSGKISPDDAHQQIRELYRRLSRTHRGLNIADE